MRAAWPTSVSVLFSIVHFACTRPTSSSVFPTLPTDHILYADCDGSASFPLPPSMNPAFVPPTPASSAARAAAAAGGRCGARPTPRFSRPLAASTFVSFDTLSGRSFSGPPAPERHASRVPPWTMSTTVYGTGDSASPPPFASLFEGDGRGGDTPPAPIVYTNDSVAVSLVEEVAATPADRPVVLLWLRHYGCTLCKKAAAEASEALGGADGAGAPLLIAIGCGTPEQAVAFQADIGFQGTLYSDPRRDTYEALRFKSGVSSVFNLPALGKVLSSFASGYSQAWGVRTRSPLQQGGVVVTRGGGGGDAAPPRGLCR